MNAIQTFVNKDGGPVKCKIFIKMLKKRVINIFYAVKWSELFEISNILQNHASFNVSNVASGILKSVNECRFVNECKFRV